jgi:shikimate kinase
MENVSAILPALDEFRDCLWDLQKSLMDGDGERFTELFSLGKELRDSWLCYKKRDALPENIVLCGVKHCGKSSVGSAIASMWQIPLRDSDDEIVAADGGKRSVREIYIQEGEEYFRKLEAETIARMAADPIHGVIALGGGALSNPFLSAEVKKQLGFKVWLDVDDETAFERIKKNGLPEFLASENDPFGKLVRINADRRKVFAGDCDVKIIADKEVRRTAMQVLSACKEKFSL